MFLLIALWKIENTPVKLFEVLLLNQVVTWLKWGCQECRWGRPWWWRRPSSKTPSTTSRLLLLRPSLSPRYRLLFSSGLSILKHFNFHIWLPNLLADHQTKFLGFSVSRPICPCFKFFPGSSLFLTNSTVVHLTTSAPELLWWLLLQCAHSVVSRSNHQDTKNVWIIFEVRCNFSQPQASEAFVSVLIGALVVYFYKFHIAEPVR